MAPVHADLVSKLYKELHCMAAAMMKGQRPDHTLQATGLVSELYLRLCQAQSGPWKDRDHFLAYASVAMRSVLTDHAREKKTAKRTCEREEVPLDRIVIEYEGFSGDLHAFDEALKKLEVSDPNLVVSIVARFYGGATPEEAARMGGFSTRTFERRWKVARKWLFKETQ